MFWIWLLISVITYIVVDFVMKNKILKQTLSIMKKMGDHKQDDERYNII